MRDIDYNSAMQAPGEKRNHWAVYHRHWSKLRPPLRPHPNDVAAMMRLVGEAAPVLLLGVTPEYAPLGRDLVAVDRNPSMVAAVWPGDTATRRAVVGDWQALPLASATCAVVAGDGSLNAVAYPAETRAVLADVQRVLAPGGRLVTRLYEAPDPPEPVARVLALGDGPAPVSFHAFKWRLAHALVAERDDPTLAVATLRERLITAFPDRAALCAQTGWPRTAVDTIDVYEGSSVVLSFPTFKQLAALTPSGLTPPVRHTSAGYDLAERSPILVFERR